MDSTVIPILQIRSKENVPRKMLHLIDPASGPSFPSRRDVVSCAFLPFKSRIYIAVFGSTEGSAIMLIRHFD